MSMINFALPPLRMVKDQVGVGQVIKFTHEEDFRISDNLDQIIH